MVSSFSFFTLFLSPTTPHTQFFLACFIPCTTVHFSAVSLSPEGQWVCSCCFYSQSYGWVCTWRRNTTLWCGHMCYSCIAQPSVALVLAGLASIYPGPSWLHCDPLTTAALKWRLAKRSGSHMRVSEGRRWWFDLQNKKKTTNKKTFFSNVFWMSQSVVTINIITKNTNVSTSQYLIFFYINFYNNNIMAKLMCTSMATISLCFH